MTLSYDIVVVGAGHAGCEAAVAAANMGAHTCLVTIDMNKVGQMSCNPAVGGIAKGQIVREVDALGGQMGIIADSTTLQFRMLNTGKGPAVWSPRAQCDRAEYIRQWRRTLDAADRLDIWQDQARELLVEHGHAAGIKTIWGVTIRARCVIITAGTFLNGLMHIGQCKVEGGRCAEPAVHHLTESIAQHGIRTGRMKTGTPVRIDRRSVDFTLTERQDGDKSATAAFSFMGRNRTPKQLPCWAVSTNDAVHTVLRSALDRSPLYNGQIQSIGPRYCPSIETKLVTFPNRSSHPLFLEPEGADTNEMYLNGFSSSMPAEVQLEALRHIPALKNARIYRPGYAIEYDYFDPTQLLPSLESKIVKGLFLAGQVNGTTGYEEAAGQGLIAGINAALHCGNAAPLVLRRDEAYIGVLVDDLTTKGVDEPYRMFTSRAEYRMLLRQDNADARLTRRGYELGIVSRKRYDAWKEKQQEVDKITAFCNNATVKPNEINATLEHYGSALLHRSTTLASLLSRPQIGITTLADAVPTLKEMLLSPQNRREEIAEEVEITTKYAGYIERERQQADKMARLEAIKIKGHFDYKEIKAISTEGRQKLAQIDPETLAQAGRIPGVSPSDVNVLLVMMNR